MQDWKTRWCVLRGAAFLYYKEQDMAKEQGARALTPAHAFALPVSAAAPEALTRCAPPAQWTSMAPPWTTIPTWTYSALSSRSTTKQARLPRVAIARLQF